jgi:hypothetical protein
VLDHILSPIGSPLLTTVVGLVVLMLRWARKSLYPHPNLLLQTLSRLPHMQQSPLDVALGNRGAIAQLEFFQMSVPITTRVTLPNLH